MISIVPTTVRGSHNCQDTASVRLQYIINQAFSLQPMSGAARVVPTSGSPANAPKNVPHEAGDAVISSFLLDPDAWRAGISCGLRGRTLSPGAMTAANDGSRPVDDSRDGPRSGSTTSTTSSTATEAVAFYRNAAVQRELKSSLLFHAAFGLGMGLLLCVLFAAVVHLWPHAEPAPQERWHMQVVGGGVESGAGGSASTAAPARRLYLRELHCDPELAHLEPCARNRELILSASDTTLPHLLFLALPGVAGERRHVLKFGPGRFWDVFYLAFLVPISGNLAFYAAMGTRTSWVMDEKVGAQLLFNTLVQTAVIFYGMQKDSVDAIDTYLGVMTITMIFFGSHGCRRRLRDLDRGIVINHEGERAASTVTVGLADSAQSLSSVHSTTTAGAGIARLRPSDESDAGFLGAVSPGQAEEYKAKAKVVLESADDEKPFSAGRAIFLAAFIVVMVVVFGDGSSRMLKEFYLQSERDRQVTMLVTYPLIKVVCDVLFLSVCLGVRAGKREHWQNVGYYIALFLLLPEVRGLLTCSFSSYTRYNPVELCCSPHTGGTSTGGTVLVGCIAVPLVGIHLRRGSARNIPEYPGTGA